MKDYQEAVQWLYTQLPMYQRIGAAAYKADLTNTLKLCDYLGNPQTGFTSIHIAGTNGKGSTSHMLASILQSAGYKVGLYTSPHLKSFTERIRINGREIEHDFVTDFVNKHHGFFGSFDPSFFEITVAMAFDYFNQQKVDVAVIETGLGGRLDSTNIITPVLSVITNIGYDHQNLLGNTLEKIASEKAGIIKKNVPVVIGELQSETMQVFQNKALEMEAPIIFADEIWELTGTEYQVEDGKNLQVLNYRSKEKNIEIQTDQLGIYQRKNCRTVLVAIDKLNQSGLFNIPQSAFLRGMKDVTAISGLQGRWQILGTEPTVIADTGHNEAGIQQIVTQLEMLGANQLRMVLGFVNDKSIHNILQILPRNAHYYFTQATIPRAKPAEEVYLEAFQIGLRGSFYTDAQVALQTAKADAGPGDVIFIGGSTFVVAELI
jgi:dihydrofolate synthase/folylpolyglutamate synthase